MGGLLFRPVAHLTFPERASERGRMVGGVRQATSLTGGGPSESDQPTNRRTADDQTQPPTYPTHHGPSACEPHLSIRRRRRRSYLPLLSPSIVTSNYREEFFGADFLPAAILDG